MQQEGVADAAIRCGDHIGAAARDDFLPGRFQLRAQIGVLPRLAGIEQKVGREGELHRQILDRISNMSLMVWMTRALAA